MFVRPPSRHVVAIWNCASSHFRESAACPSGSSGFIAGATAAAASPAPPSPLNCVSRARSASSEVRYRSSLSARWSCPGRSPAPPSHPRARSRRASRARARGRAAAIEPKIVSYASAGFTRMAAACAARSCRSRRRSACARSSCPADASNGAVRLSLGASTASRVAAEPSTAQLSAPVPDECPPPVIVVDRPKHHRRPVVERDLLRDAASGPRHSAWTGASPVAERGGSGYTSMKLCRPPTPEPSGGRARCSGTPRVDAVALQHDHQPHRLRRLARAPRVERREQRRVPPRRTSATCVGSAWSFPRSGTRRVCPGVARHQGADHAGERAVLSVVGLLHRRQRAGVVRFSARPMK